jgi:hypothetical protein
MLTRHRSILNEEIKMAIIQSGADSTLLTVDPSFKSARVTIKPDELTGAYQLSLASGALTTVAASTASAGTLFSFRYAPGTSNVCVVKRVSVGWVQTTAFGAAQQMGLGLFVARGFSGADSGGTAATLSGDNQKMRTSLATTGVSNINVGTTAALTAGTRTLDAQPLGAAYFWVPGVGTQLVNTELLAYDVNDYPLVLANQEGFCIQNLILMGATGVGTLVVNVEWFEASAY